MKRTLAAVKRGLVPAVEILVDTLGKSLTAAIVGRDNKSIGRWLAGEGLIGITRSAESGISFR